MKKMSIKVKGTVWVYRFFGFYIVFGREKTK